MALCRFSSLVSITSSVSMAAIPDSQSMNTSSEHIFLEEIDGKLVINSADLARLIEGERPNIMVPKTISAIARSAVPIKLEQEKIEISTTSEVFTIYLAKIGAFGKIAVFLDNWNVACLRDQLLRVLVEDDQLSGKHQLGGLFIFFDNYPVKILESSMQRLLKKNGVYVYDLKETEHEPTRYDIILKAA